MKKANTLQIAALLAAGLSVGLTGCAGTGGGEEKGADKKAAHADDAGLGHDYRTFTSGSSEVKYGQIGDSYTSELVMYLAGNQFMVMEELIKDFQSKNSDIKTIYVETIPPGQILKGQILKQGEIEGQKTAMNPDLFASVNLKHLKKLSKLYLSDTNVTDAGLEHLAEMKSLQRLDVTNTKVTAAGVGALRNRCPDLKIEHEVP